jgi:peptidoglycan hydrolase-like protein with peptidoglycan-binding domain
MGATRVTTPARASRPLSFATLAVVLATLVAPAGAAAVGSASVAALQAGLRARGFYAGDVDGYAGPLTDAAVRVLQRRAGLAVDGIAGPATRRALGWRGRHPYGSRTIAPRARGWDVAALQFKLAWRGFPSGAFDGAFGERTRSAVVRFQRRAGLLADGIAGPATLRGLRAPPPVSPLRLGLPVQAPVGDRFGPRGASFHAGLDFPAPARRAVVAAGPGTVRAVARDGGWGRYVTVDHGRCVTSLYAHLSAAAVRRGERVAAGRLVGRVGATGRTTGPHLHFEVIVCGANVDPATALG